MCVCVFACLCVKCTYILLNRYIRYEDLLQQDDRGDQGHFAEELRDQFLLSVQQSYIAVEASIREATIQHAAENGRIIPSEGPQRILAHSIVFKEAPCVQNCDTLMKESLVAACPLREYKGGDMIIVEGGSDRAMYLVIEGTAFSEKHGHEKLIKYGSGELFGDLAALSSRGKDISVGDAPRRQATVTAHEDTLVLVLDAAEVTLQRNKAASAGDEKFANCCTYALAAIDSILDAQAIVQKAMLAEHKTAEKLAELKRLAKFSRLGEDDTATVSAGGFLNLQHGLWTTVADCWRGCMDYVGPDDPDYDYEQAAEEADAADAEISAITDRAGKKKPTSLSDPASAEERARALVAAGLGEDAERGWEIAAGGLSCTKRVWLPDFIQRLRSVFIPLPRPEWLAAQARKQGAEVIAPGTRQLSSLEKQAVSDVWKELDRDGTGSLPSSKLTEVIEMVYGYEASHTEEHALLLSTRYGRDVDDSDTSVPAPCHFIVSIVILIIELITHFHHQFKFSILMDLSFWG